jgi:3-hydroxyisobutyrate dehydrogenase-like beta-hydroxyacid dehydrogenase
VRVAVLGAGRMGSAMARRLANQGFDVVIWNRTRDKAEAVGVGTVAETPTKAVQGADAVVSSLTGPDAVRDVYLGANGVVSVVGGRVVIEMSTAGPHVVLELVEPLRERGAALVEAPVLGSIGAVEKGELYILAGGDTGDIERARPVLEKLGEVLPVGSIGSANRLKLVANSMLAVCSGASAELQAAGVAAGLEAEIVFNVLRRYFPYLEARRAGYLEGRYQPVTFAVKDLLKDLSLALELFRDNGSEAPYTVLSHQLYSEVAGDHAEDEMSAINERFRRPSESA